jgi:hypothetical protein
MGWGAFFAISSTMSIGFAVCAKLMETEDFVLPRGGWKTAQYWARLGLQGNLDKAKNFEVMKRLTHEKRVAKADYQ